MSIINIGGLIADIQFHNFKNCYYGQFINAKYLGTAYGDTRREVEEELEEMYNEYMKE